jgi:hypothetical protein
MAQYKNKQTGEVVEANRITNPSHLQRDAGVEPGYWAIITSEGVASTATPAAFADAYEYASADPDAAASADPNAAGTNAAGTDAATGDTPTQVGDKDGATVGDGKVHDVPNP